MNIFTSLSSIPQTLKGSVIAIGNFDGVHLGHRALIDMAKNLATANHKPLGVLTFEPHPRALFRPDDPPFRLTPPALKHGLLLQCGVDFIVSLPFDWDFASQSAEAFVSRILKDSLSPSHIIIGEGFGFGQLRKGNVETIRAAGIPVTECTPERNGVGEIYSSTTIRNAFRGGDIDAGNKMLGWEWEISGVVVRGDRRGHELGYPTANVGLSDLLHPAYGIYAAQVMIEGEDQWRMAAVNIGIRPMFEVKVGQVEAHILDFPDRDFYGRVLRVRPVKRLRGEAKFASLDALVEQMERDCMDARVALASSK